MQKNQYFLAAVLSYFLWGFFGLALKPIHNYASLDILFYRLFFSVLLMSVINIFFRLSTIRQNWNLFRNQDQKIKTKFTKQTILGGIILIFNWFTFIYVMNHIGVKVASFAYLVCPILTTVLAFFILKEKLNRWQWSAVFISVISCTLLSYHDFKNLIYSLLVASTYSFYLINQRKNFGFDKFLVLNIQLVISTVIILPFFPHYSGAIPSDGLFYGCIFIIVTLFTIAPLFLNLFALQGLNSATIGILIYINPIINFSLAVFYFNESITDLQLFCYGLILFSIVLFNKKLLFKSKKQLVIK